MSVFITLCGQKLFCQHRKLYPNSVHKLLAKLTSLRNCFRIQFMILLVSAGSRFLLIYLIYPHPASPWHSHLPHLIISGYRRSAPWQPSGYHDTTPITRESNMIRRLPTATGQLHLLAIRQQHPLYYHLTPPHPLLPVHPYSHHIILFKCTHISF